MSRFSCGQSYAVSLYSVPDGAHVYSRPLYCKSWACEHCRKKKARKYAKRTVEIFSGTSKVRFLTVTFSRALPLEETWKIAPACWNRFRTAFVKRFGKTKFVRVVEPHKDGYPHYHILLDRYIPASWLEKELRNAGFGKIRDIRLITDIQAFYYVVKYLRKPWRVKKADELASMMRVRRYNSSRDYVPEGGCGRRYRLVALCHGESALTACLSYVDALLRRLGGESVGGSGPNCSLRYGNYYLFASRNRCFQKASGNFTGTVDVLDYLHRQLFPIMPGYIHVSLTGREIGNLYLLPLSGGGR